MFHEDDENKMYLVYSKKLADSLPITTTVIDRKPCLDPTQVSTHASFYPTELDRGDFCQIGYHGLEYDPRYTEVVGESITEFELQIENGIIAKL